MIRFCDGTDPNLLGVPAGEPCRCGLRFDDEDRSVIYPHDPIQGGRFEPFIPKPRDGREFSEAP